MSKEINIDVVIADRHYHPIANSMEEEQRVRKAANIIKLKLLELKGQYKAAKDKQDLLAMTSLLLCVDLLELQETVSSNEAGNLHSKLDELNGILTDFLNR